MNGLVNDSAYEHPDWAAFVRAIRANPTDSLTRKVAADWLEEYGNAARAGLIRLQCDTNAKTLVGRPGVGLMAMAKIEGRVAELPITPAIPEASLTLDRGFVVVAELPWEMWERFGDWLLCREPVAKVVLTTAPVIKEFMRTTTGLAVEVAGRNFHVVDAASKDDPVTEDELLAKRWPEIAARDWRFPAVGWPRTGRPNPLDDIRAARDRIMRESYGDRFR